MASKSFLFVPGDSGRKLDRAASSGADVLLLDLEDSVMPEHKVAARDTVAAYMRNRTAGGPALFVRVNSITSGLIDDDLAAIVPARPDGVMLPKAEGGASVVHLDAKLTAQEAMAGLADGATRIIAIATETARAVFLAGSYDNASPRLAGLTWGAEDLSAEVGASDTRGPAMQLARSLCLLGAVAARVQPIDTVFVDFRDEAGLRRECEAAKRDGFTGKMAIHPAQVAVINETFAPTAAELEQARRIVAAFADGSAGAVSIAGRMYDRPHLAKALRLLNAKPPRHP